MVGTIYKRGRPNGAGKIVQRAELRLDGVAGCLRTPRGGSSRQTVMFIDGDTVKARLLSKKEAARLMGLPDEYILPERYNDAYLLAGDGVAVPVVRFLADTIFEPILKLKRSKQAMKGLIPRGLLLGKYRNINSLLAYHNTFWA